MAPAHRSVVRGGEAGAQRSAEGLLPAPARCCQQPHLQTPAAWARSGQRPALPACSPQSPVSCWRPRHRPVMLGPRRPARSSRLLRCCPGAAPCTPGGAAGARGGPARARHVRPAGERAQGQRGGAGGARLLLAPVGPCCPVVVAGHEHTPRAHGARAPGHVAVAGAAGPAAAWLRGAWCGGPGGGEAAAAVE